MSSITDIAKYVVLLAISIYLAWSPWFCSLAGKNDT